jgi:HD-like signal output (HDOD) protein
MIDLQALTRSAQDIEPLPASVARLAQLTSGDRWTFQAVEEVVRLDQALSLRLLKAANSAASASATPIVTIRDAMVRLGIRSLLSLATAVGVQKRMRTALPEYGLSEGELWRHGVAAALAAESLQSYCSEVVPAEAYTAALLHDIGKLVMARFLDADVLRVLADAREQGGLSSLRAESELLLVHHGELGGLIAQHWCLPHRFVVGIIHHHTPDLADDIVADAVHVANIAAKRAGTGHSAIDSDCAVAASSLERLGMTDADVTALAAHVTVELEKVLAVHAG